jgi:hypothetical protein
MLYENYSQEKHRQLSMFMLAKQSKKQCRQALQPFITAQTGRLFFSHVKTLIDTSAIMH